PPRSAVSSTKRSAAPPPSNRSKPRRSSVAAPLVYVSGVPSARRQVAARPAPVTIEPGPPTMASTLRNAATAVSVPSKPSTAPAPVSTTLRVVLPLATSSVSYPAPPSSVPLTVTPSASTNTSSPASPAKLPPVLASSSKRSSPPP